MFGGLPQCMRPHAKGFTQTADCELVRACARMCAQLRCLSGSAGADSAGTHRYLDSACSALLFELAQHTPWDAWGSLLRSCCCQSCKRADFPLQRQRLSLLRQFVDAGLGRASIWTRQLEQFFRQLPAAAFMSFGAGCKWYLQLVAALNTAVSGAFGV